MKYFLIFLALLFSISSSYADDSYDPDTGILNIPLVNVGGNNGTFYANVQVSIASILTINSANRPSPGYDTYDPSTNKLGIPVVNVNGTTYSNVYVTVGNVLNIESVCSSAAACGINVGAPTTVATGSGGVASCSSSNASTTLSTDSVYYAPASYYNAILTCIQPYSLGSSITSLTNRNYYLLSDSSSSSSAANYLQVGSSYTANSGYSASAGTIGSVYTQYNYLTKLVQAVSDSSSFSTR